MRNKPIEHLAQVTVGKWKIEGAIYEEYVVLKGVCSEK
jgi:hypothetical protein